MEYLLYVQQVNILENKSYLMAKNFPQKKPTPRLKRNQAKNVDREHAGVGHMEGGCELRQSDQGDKKQNTLPIKMM